MERFWNIIHYFVYLGFYKLHLLTNKINPVLFLYKTKLFKRRFKKLGIDNPYDELNYAFKRPDIGICIIFAGGAMGGLTLCLISGISSFYHGISKTPVKLNLTTFIIIVVIVLAINYLLIERNDKYIKYFKEFDKMSGIERKKWKRISIAVVLGIILFCIGGFIFMVMIGHK